MSAPHDIHLDDAMTIRLLAEGTRDEVALRRLAERDGALLPARPVLGAWVGNELLAAVGLGDAEPVIADPFRASAGAASILASRAGQVRRIRSGAAPEGGAAHASSSGAIVRPAEASCSQ